MQLCSVIANSAKLKSEKDKEKVNADLELREKLKKEIEQEISKNQENLSENSEKTTENEQNIEKKEGIEENKEQIEKEKIDTKKESDGV